MAKPTREFATINKATTSMLMLENTQLTSSDNHRGGSFAKDANIQNSTTDTSRHFINAVNMKTWGAKMENRPGLGTMTIDSISGQNEPTNLEWDRWCH